MNLPPALIRMKFRKDGWSIPTLWLPLVLFWPLGALLLIPVAIFILIRPRLHYEAALALYSVICACRGTHVDLSDARHHLKFSVY